MTKAERTCNKHCFFAGREWAPGEVIAEADVPEGGLPTHFGPTEERVSRWKINTAAGVKPVDAPRPEAKDAEIPVADHVTTGAPATLAQAQEQLLGETVLQKDGQVPMTLGEAQAFA